MISAAPVACPRCPHGPDALVHLSHQPGDMAGHMVQSHNVSASVALREARAAIARAGAVVLAPAPAPAPPAPQETPMPRKDAPKPKYKRPDYKCGKCGSTEHTARSSECPKAGHFEMKDRGATRKAAAVANGGGVAATLRQEIARREREIAALRDTLKVLGG